MLFEANKDLVVYISEIRKEAWKQPEKKFLYKNCEVVVDGPDAIPSNVWLLDCSFTWPEEDDE